MSALAYTNDPEWRPADAVCAQCRRRKPFYAFMAAPKSVTGRSAICSRCANAWEDGAADREAKLDILENQLYAETYRGKNPRARYLSQYEQAKAQNVAVDLISEPSAFCYQCGWFETHPHHDDPSVPKKVKWFCLNHYPKRHIKICPGCVQEKPFIYFSPDPTRFDGRRRLCKSCTAAISRKSDASISPEEKARRNAQRRATRKNKSPERREAALAVRRAVRRKIVD